MGRKNWGGQKPVFDEWEEHVNYMQIHGTLRKMSDLNRDIIILKGDNEMKSFLT